MELTEYNISITKLDNAPDDWPIEEIVITVNAEDDEKAEQIADYLISMLELDWDKLRNSSTATKAMEINETYEV